MSRAARIAVALGVGTVAVLVAVTGISNIASLIGRAGGRLLWLVPLQTLPLMLDVLGWRCLIASRVPLLPLFAIACVRQAINRLLPVANVGGDVVGIRLLSRLGIPGTTATGSVIVELLLGLYAQYLFVACGVAGVLTLLDDTRLTRALTLGLALGLTPLIAIALVFRHGGLVTRISRFASRKLGVRFIHGDLIEVGDRLELSIQRTIGATSRTLQSVVWQLSGYVAGGAETWLALRWLGTPVSVLEAITLESLIQGAKSLFFVVPGGMGVQEAGLIGLGHFLGLSADVALALSLTKRMREVVFGVPVLVAWQWLTWKIPD